MAWEPRDGEEGSGRGQWHSPCPAWPLCAPLCNKRVTQMSPQNNQVSRAGGTPGLAGTLGGWPRPACPVREALCVFVCVCLRVCAAHLGLGWEWKRKKERKEEQAQYSYSFFLKSSFWKWWDFQNGFHWTSLVVQWLELHAPNTGIPGSTPGQGARSHVWQLKIPHAASRTQCSQMNK